MNRRELAAGMRKIAKSSSLLKKTSLSILLLNLYSSFKNYEITVEVHLNTTLVVRFGSVRRVRSS